MDLLLVKKIVSYLVAPYTLAILLLLAGLWLAGGRRARTGRAVAWTGLALLVVQSMPLLPNTAAGIMQKDYPALVREEDIPRDARWIVVLSGASNDDPAVPVTSRNMGDSLHRVVEGIALAWRMPGAKLLFSGGSVYGEAPAARHMADMAKELKFPLDRVVLEEQSRDTDDQARIIAGMVGKEKMVLVTSARHMPRSMELFRKYGVDAMAAPVALPIKGRGGGEGGFSALLLAPTPRAAAMTASLAHEVMGRVWEKVKGVMK